MIPIDPILVKKYQLMLQKNRIPKNEQSYFLKWLRYYLDFCHKYGFEKADSNSLHRYIEKLRSKKQNQSQQQQASNAVQLFYSLSRQKPELEQPFNVDAKVNKTVPVKEKRPRYSTRGITESLSSGPADNFHFKQQWQEALAACYVIQWAA